MHETISTRELQRNFYKYFKVGKYVVTSNGVEKYVVTIEDYKEHKQDPYVVKQGNTPNLNSVPEAYNTYGCGCIKKEGKDLCSKHGRV